MGCVYLAKNTINNKCYIGKTISILKQRKKTHRCTSNQRNPKTPFHKALKKYGFENFKWMKLYKSNDNKKLIKKEIYFIKKYRTKPPHGYNLTNGGDGGLPGHKHSKRTKRKISESARRNTNAIGSIRSKEYRRKQSESHIGKHHTKESKEKMSKTRKGVPKTKEQNEKNRLGQLKRLPASKETRRKLSISIKRYWMRKKNECN